jgi:hypothetical protein|tara:strand:+ start:4190 stop:4345 length:156 start_codon:yes stop_codon:yes gene_type:complete
LIGTTAGENWLVLAKFKLAAVNTSYLDAYHSDRWLKENGFDSISAHRYLLC